MDETGASGQANSRPAAINDKRRNKCNSRSLQQTDNAFNYSASAASAPLPKKSSNNRRNQRSFEADHRGARNNGSREVTRPELGSVSRPGSKKGEMHNYIQFGYDHRRYTKNEFYQRNGYRQRQISASYGSSYNKEQYLQATCQFVVLEGSDYSVHLADPDLIIDWDHIEELRLMDDTIPTCPICLYPPVAAKITRCGHIYCWTCVLHYLALSENAWRKCPICYESIYKDQLKSVISLKSEQLKTDEQLTMLLLRREKGANVILPASHWMKQHKQMRRVTDENIQFSKILLISPKEVIDIVLERERTALSCKLVEIENEPEVCFVHDALQSLTEREKQLKQKCSSKPTVHEAVVEYLAQPLPPTDPSKIVSYVDAFNDEKVRGGTCSVTSSRSAPPTVGDSHPSPTSTDGDESHALFLNEIAVVATAAAAALNETSYYFYQAEDGRHSFLHPCNVHCLIHEFGSLEAAPEKITGRIVQIEPVIMTEDMRRRFRYLGHLPLTTNFTLVELELADDIISKETLLHFADELSKRNNARLKRARDEKRQQVQAERWERAMMQDPRNFSRNFSSNDIRQPEIAVTTVVQSAQRDIEAALAATSMADFPAAGADTTESNPDAASALSFAQMLRQGKPKFPAVVAPQPAAQTSATHSNGVDESQESSVRDYRDAFGDAMQLALDNFKKDESNGSNSENKSKSKKKSKGRLLFAM